MAELVSGVYGANRDLKRIRRKRHLQRIRSKVEPLDFDLPCAYAYGLIYRATILLGRKPRGSRAVDLMIAATALAHGLPLYTLNAKDLRGLEGLIEIVDVGSSIGA